MTDPEFQSECVRPFIEDYFERLSQDFNPENPSVPLVHTPYGSEEVMEALESLMSTHVTMGEKVEKFEEEWSSYIGMENGAMTNSGSSANLLAMKAVAEDFAQDAEVIVPAVGWSTMVFPILDAGATPVFVDVDAKNFRVDSDSLESAINSNTEAILLVHLLGNPADMDKVVELCEEHDLVLIEDCAQAHGAEFKGQKVGSFGDISTFSFSFSHHITTTEGGIALTDLERYKKRMKVLRSWGRARDVENAEEFVEDDKDIGLDFAFVSQGYNVRPTEIQAAMGIHQISVLDGYVKKRRENAEYMSRKLEGVEEICLMKDRSETLCSYLHYPILIGEDVGHDADELREHLEERGIETRPMLSGNLTKHPAFRSREYVVSGELQGADWMHSKGLYVSCHPYLEEEHMDHIVESVKSFFE